MHARRVGVARSQLRLARARLRLDAAAATAFLAESAAAGISEAASTTRSIGECARLSGSTVLLTLNPKHFDPPPTGVAIVDPTQSNTEPLPLDPVVEPDCDQGDDCC